MQVLPHAKKGQPKNNYWFPEVVRPSTKLIESAFEAFDLRPFKIINSQSAFDLFVFDCFLHNYFDAGFLVHWQSCPFAHQGPQEPHTFAYEVSFPPPFTSFQLPWNLLSQSCSHQPQTWQSWYQVFKFFRRFPWCSKCNSNTHNQTWQIEYRQSPEFFPRDPSFQVFLFTTL